MVVGGDGAQGASSGLGGRGRDTLLAEMQKLWPRWELKLLLSLGSDQAPASAQSSSSWSSPSLLPWAWSVLADHMSSFAGYVSRDRGKNVWDKAHERCLDRTNADDAGYTVGDKVATVLAVEGWRPLRSCDYDDDDKATSATRRSRPTRDLLRQSIAAFVRMSEESDSDDQIDDDSDAAKKTKRWNLLHLHPSSTTGDTTSCQSDKEVLHALAARVKQSMRQMELVAANDDDDEGEDEGGEPGEEGHEPINGEEGGRPPPSGSGQDEEEESWVLV